MEQGFETKKPDHAFLSALIDYFFYIDIPVSQLATFQEHVIQFPRITFGYFFNHPYLVTNHSLGQSQTVLMALSRISTHQITVQPQSDRVRILGAHAKPYLLALLTRKSISDMPWLIDTTAVFGQEEIAFQEAIGRCRKPECMFDEMEKIFLSNILERDISLIRKAVAIIEKQNGTIHINELANQLEISERTLRNQFYHRLGCSPKEYIHLVKLRNAVYEMKHSKKSLTNITYDNDYFDQAHFINSFKKITGNSPKNLRNKISDFRFLQF